MRRHQHPNTVAPANLQNEFVACIRPVASVGGHYRKNQTTIWSANLLDPWKRHTLHLLSSEWPEPRRLVSNIGREARRPPTCPNRWALRGFIGQATFVAEAWKPFALLAWFPVIQMGKSIVEDNGVERMTTST